MKRRTIPSFRGALALEGQAFATYGAEIPHQTKLQDVQASGFWYPQFKTLEPGARIRCEWECGSRAAVLRVMGKDAGAKEVLVALESVHEFPVPAVPDGFTLEFVNKGIGWRILEEGRRSVRRSGFPTAFAAAHWLVGDRTPPETQESGAPKADEGGKSVRPNKPVKPNKPDAETNTSPAAS